MRSTRKKSAVFLLAIVFVCALTVLLIVWKDNKANGSTVDKGANTNTAMAGDNLDIISSGLTQRTKNDHSPTLPPEAVQHQDNYKVQFFASTTTKTSKKELLKILQRKRTLFLRSDVKLPNQVGSGFETSKTTSATFISSYIKKPRRNIIIIAHGRSGSSITGDIFNRHPSVFYMYEPLQIVGRIADRKSSDYGQTMSNVLSNILRCRFNDQVTKEIESYYSFHPNASVAIGTLTTALCPFNKNDPKWDPKLCSPLTSERLENVCRQNYKMTVIKILIHRISKESIENVLIACAPQDIDCKFIFLARDPRAIIASARSLGFFKNNEQGLREFSNKTCHLTEKNVLFVKNVNSSVQNRVLLIRYEDFAMEPLKSLETLYQFAGIPSIESIRTWLYKRTHPKQNAIKAECRNVHPVFCTVDDASQAVNRWRVKVAIQDIMIMEEYCENAMILMGYKPIDGSLQLLHNLSVSLFTKNFVSKKWFST